MTLERARSLRDVPGAPAPATPPPTSTPFTGPTFGGNHKPSYRIGTPWKGGLGWEVSEKYEGGLPDRRMPHSAGEGGVKVFRVRAVLTY